MSKLKIHLLNINAFLSPHGFTFCPEMEPPPHLTKSFRLFNLKRHSLPSLRLYATSVEY